MSLQSTKEYSITGIGTGDVETEPGSLIDRRFNVFCFLVSKEPILPSVRIEAGNGDVRPLNP